MSQAQMEQWPGRHRDGGMTKYVDVNKHGGLQSHWWPVGNYEGASGAEPECGSRNPDGTWAWLEIQFFYK